MELHFGCWVWLWLGLSGVVLWSKYMGLRCKIVAVLSGIELRMVNKI